jgi:ribonuclease HI
MIRYVPQYLLYVETSSVFVESRVRDDDCLQPAQLGSWRFILESLDELGRMEVADEEPGTWGTRLELLAVVRGLEALEQPSRVTLIARSAYLNDRLGRMTGSQDESVDQPRDTPWQDYYQNADLWKRVDAAMGYHHLETRNWRLDGAHLKKRERRSALKGPHYLRGSDRILVEQHDRTHAASSEFGCQRLAVA